MDSQDDVALVHKLEDYFRGRHFGTAVKLLLGTHTSYIRMFGLKSYFYF